MWVCQNTQVVRPEGTEAPSPGQRPGLGAIWALPFRFAPATFGSARIIGLLLLVQAHKKGGAKLMTPP